MSYYKEPLATITLAANADLSSYLGCGMKFTSGNAAVQTTAAADVIGILMNEPDAAGEPALIAVAGVAKCRAGGTVTQGAHVAIEATTGRFVDAASTNVVIGTALEGAADGEYFACNLHKMVEP